MELIKDTGQIFSPQIKPKTRCPSVQSTKGTQTKTWKELIQSELDSDHFHDRLFNTTDTEHDSEETIVSN